MFGCDFFLCVVSSCEFCSQVLVVCPLFQHKFRLRATLEIESSLEKVANTLPAGETMAREPLGLSCLRVGSCFARYVYVVA